MIIKLTQKETCIWVNTAHITYMWINHQKKITRIYVLDMNEPIDVMETPEQIMELIKKP
jgi:hypothetical protein